MVSNISRTEYFFYEWLITQKNMTSEQYEELTEKEFLKLKIEFIKAYVEAVHIQCPKK